jgi:nitrite reductase/ring-hydroxylating ferredoxin subunit
MTHWFPLVRSEEVEPRQVVHVKLCDQEIALWRSDTGSVNAWENRCPHRGVRLSIGINTGQHLVCQYHGWRFASDGGQCVFIPSHPTQKPASTLCVTTYPVIERLGFVWTTLKGPVDEPTLPVPESAPRCTLRSLYFNVSAACLHDALRCGYPIDDTTPGTVESENAWTLIARPESATDHRAVVFLLQPVTSGETWLHGLLVGDARMTDATARLRALTDHNARWTALRRAVEAQQTNP